MYVHFGNEIQGTDAGFHFVYLWNYWICGGFYGNGFYKKRRNSHGMADFRSFRKLAALGSGVFTGNNFIGILFLEIFQKSGSTHLGGCYERDKNRVEDKETDLLAMGLFLLVFFLAVLGLDKCLGFSQRISAEKFPWIAAGFVAVSWIVADLYMSFDWAVGFWQNQKAISSGTVWDMWQNFFAAFGKPVLNEIFPIIAGKYDRIELGIVSGSMVLFKKLLHGQCFLRG